MLKHILMSDIRTKLLLGTSIATVAMMFALVSGMGISTNDTSVSETSYQLMGHVAVMSVNPDGTVLYTQGDNAVQDGGKDVAGATLFDFGGAGLTFSCIQLGDSGAVAVGTSDTVLTQKLATQTILCDANSPVTTNAANPAGAKSDIEVQFTIVAADAPTTITEVALCTGTTATTVCANMLSHFELAVPIPVVTDTQVTVTYTMTTG